MKRLTIEEAEAQGYYVDTNIYPHFGYTGSRFRPAKQVEVYTELEAKLIKLADEVGWFQVLYRLIDSSQNYKSPMSERAERGCEYSKAFNAILNWRMD